MARGFVENHSEFVTKATKAGARLNSLREAGIQHFNKHGFPSRRDEDWKYTSVKPVQDASWLPSVMSSSKLSFGGEEIIRSFLSKDLSQIVFINGVLSEKYSNLKEIEKKLQFKTLVEKDDWISETQKFRDSFEALNSAFTEQGLILDVPANTSVEKPVQFLFFSDLGEGIAPAIQPRIVVRVGERSKISVVETYGGISSSYFVNAVVDFDVHESASLTYLRLQLDSNLAFNVGRTTIQLAKEAQLFSMSVSLGAKISRHNLDVLLQGSHSSAKVHGLSLVDGDRHADHHTLIDHQSPECITDQLYKSVLAGTSRSVFDGRVVIRPQSQKANSSQMNNNLLLSLQAEADSKPSLEVYADDVKATHGSTVGQMDRDEVFYLQSRGISRDRAVQMLSRGFAFDLIFQIENEAIRNYVDMWVSKFLQGMWK